MSQTIILFQFLYVRLQVNPLPTVQLVFLEIQKKITSKLDDFLKNPDFNLEINLVINLNEINF